MSYPVDYSGAIRLGNPWVKLGSTTFDNTAHDLRILEPLGTEMISMNQNVQIV